MTVGELTPDLFPEFGLTRCEYYAVDGVGYAYRVHGVQCVTSLKEEGAILTCRNGRGDIVMLFVPLNYELFEITR